ncbi:MAG: DUF1214 domain-containing protein [Beijerinckiaceae bacterium]|nr:DUF1214 domain-containing protein [Beijerinckiaceae bacterium]MCI0736909.1 DUF1214 domain-containing protein [Beijerinckiaceae bacterium]
MSLGTASAKEGGSRAQVLLLGKFLSAAAVGLLLGAFITWVVVERGRGFGAVEAGPWTNWSRSGTSEVDPYSRAILAYSGEIPLSESEGTSFIAYGDSTGAEFDPACDYVLKGEIPLARYWTLTLLSPAGAPVATRAGRQGFTSSEILRASNGQFEVTISRHARPGNWLPSGSTSKFVLILHLYDSELGAPVGALDAAKMPSLHKGRCE